MTSLMMMTIWASKRRRRSLLKLKHREWRDLIQELGRRGAGTHEAGAFLLTPSAGTRRVRHIEYFDDLDPDCLRGHIHFDGRAFSRLWDVCERKGLKVAADVHTHPGASVQQSSIDRANPMVASAGHVALIVPHLATRPVRPKEVGFHEYRGDGGWRSWYGRDAAARLSVRRWL